MTNGVINNMLTEEEFNRLNSLSEEDFEIESDKLSEEDFYDFVKRQGTMTPEEWLEYGLSIIDEIYGEQ